MATIYFNNGKEIWTSLTIDELKKIKVDSKDFIEIKSEQIICDEYNHIQVKHQRNYFINLNNISHIEENVSNYLGDETSI